ncbi:MAG TPA: tetratricopeptide repeat protein [Rhizomicrobium sp.]|jgi:tetratricopeptide (TPR) repeat protein|nr:tetratricopeptide repeat protein [Rhizomicrobium sp.]
MSEESAKSERGNESNPLAAALALSGGTTLDPRAAEYLQKQSRLAELQIEELEQELRLRHWSLRFGNVSAVMKVSFEIAVAFIVLAIAAGIAAAIWSAANDRGLVVEAFGVPPDLAAKGLTGEVIADKILDRLSDFQAQTVSQRVSASYANNWGDDIKVQIPETGVSIGEFNRALHQWLGHETRISGEVYRVPGGIAIAARVGGESTPVFKGGEADIDTLVDKTSQRIYRSTQPYRYASWLSNRGRLAESNAVLQSVVDGDNAHERVWAYNGLAHNMIVVGAVARADEFARRAIASDPHVLLPQFNLADGEADQGQDEIGLRAAELTLKATSAGDPELDKTSFTRGVLGMRQQIAQLTGDYLAARDFRRQLQNFEDPEDAREDEMQACASLHDLACFRAVAASLSPHSNDTSHLVWVAALQQARIALHRWDAVIKVSPTFHDGLLKNPSMKGWLALSDAPLQALAAAHLGDTKRAHALIAPTALDCVLCLRIRGQIDELDSNWNGAAYWFTRAVQQAPSAPLAYSDWGAMLLAKGDYDGAIAKFQSAHAKGPHFSDPLEMWGEALMRKNRSDLALAKFEEANKYAPNWGRLHLEWGRALVYCGNIDEAKSQFALAAHLDLSHTDAATLARFESKA